MNLQGLAARGVGVIPGAHLADYTTFRLGGPCRCLLTCGTPQQLGAAVAALAEAGERFVLIGGGSNLLVADAGVDAHVVRYASDRPAIRRSGSTVEAEGSSPLDEVVRATVEQGMRGLVCCTGIPGTVGGAVSGNAGAFGEQIGDRVESVVLMDRAGRTRTEQGRALGFAYRRSRVQETGEIVVSVRLRLEAGDVDALRRRREEILQLRREKHPDWRTTPTAGSFFRNIEPTSAAERRQAAGWFLEQAGAKEMRVGGARVFERHANIIIGDSGCSAEDVRRLSVKMAEAVRKRFGLNLIPEVRFVE